jgi:3-hydroxymyristoyl/3-hydroxydecanoyl-(acyl carrier protein) dehydratase
VFLERLPREATGKLTQATLRTLAEQHLKPPAPTDTTFDIAPDHPACDGHFPGQPLLPGAMLLSLVMEALAARPDLTAALGASPGIANVKFLSPVRPGQRLVVRFNALGSAGRGLAFEAFVQGPAGEVLAARGQLATGGAA